MPTCHAMRHEGDKNELSSNPSGVRSKQDNVLKGTDF